MATIGGGPGRLIEPPHDRPAEPPHQRRARHHQQLADRLHAEPVEQLQRLRVEPQRGDGEGRERHTLGGGRDGEDGVIFACRPANHGARTA